MMVNMQVNEQSHSRSPHGRSRPAIHRRGRSLVLALAVMLAAAAFVAGVVGFSLLIVPASAIPDAATRLKLQNDVRVTVLQTVAGLLLITGAYFTWRQLQLGRDQLRHSLDTSTAQLRLGTNVQITEQLSRSIDQLGHAKVGVRVGAVCILEQLARTSADARPGIHELLAAHIRAESTWTHHDPVTFTAIEPDPAPGDQSDIPLLKVRASDIQAALTALGRRTEVPGEAIELQSTDLRACYLGGANLRGSFMGRAMLALSDLTNADLSQAWLRRTNFRGAILINCDLRNAVLTEAILRQADLAGANLAGADLGGADVSETDLSRTILTGARSDHDTIWPDGFDWKLAGVSTTSVAETTESPDEQREHRLGNGWTR
jgi:uncharacterized protein YjbI with pentapeptide repeats